MKSGSGILDGEMYLVELQPKQGVVSFERMKGGMGVIKPPINCVFPKSSRLSRIITGLFKTDCHVAEGKDGFKASCFSSIKSISEFQLHR
jgi:hypothetical protein